MSIKPGNMENALSSTPGRHRAILLLGPTGAGKTPLGEIIQRRGLWGTTCLHFDFGARLRELVHHHRADDVTGPHPGPLPTGMEEGAFSREEIEFLREVLESGALLEVEHFPIARRILQSFMARHAAQQETCLVLNGLPRHVEQARAVDPILDVRVIVHLKCSSETVIRRIRANVGGDRTEREDDDLPSVRNKLATFRRRTAPLLEHYLRRGARVETIQVTDEMTPDEMWETLERTASRGHGNRWTP